MGDQFVDDLFNRLRQEREQQLANQVTRDDHQRLFDVAKQAWWAEFVDVLGQKVGAWNEKSSSGEPVNFTKRENGTVHVAHRHVDAEFRLDGDRVVASSHGFGQGQHGARVVLEFDDAGDGRLIARRGDTSIESPTAAAEQVLTPIFTKVFET